MTSHSKGAEFRSDMVLEMKSLDFKKLRACQLAELLKVYAIVSVSYFQKPMLAIHSGEAPEAGGEIRLIDLLRFSKKDIERLLGRKKALNIIYSKEKLVIGYVTRF